MQDSISKRGGDWMSRICLLDKLGFRGKVLFAMSIVVIPILLIMASFSYSYSKKLFESQMVEELALENEVVAQKIFTMFNSKGEIAKQLGDLEMIRDFMTSQVEIDTVKMSSKYIEINQLLTKVQENTEGVNHVWLALLKPNFLIADHGLISDQTYSILERPWVVKANATNQVSFSDLYTDYSTGKSTVSVIYPIFRNGSRLGYFGMDMHLDEIPPLITPYEMDQKKHILLTQKQQTLYDSNNIWSEFKPYLLTKEVAQKVSTSKGNFYAELQEVEGTEWHLVSYVTDEIVKKPLAAYVKMVGLMWMIAAFLILIILSWLLGSMLKDLPIIVKHIRQMKQENLVTKMHINRKDEIGEIAQSIEEMGSLLNVQVQELDFQARFDSLTKLPNRASIERELAHRIEQINNQDEIIAVTFMDLDHFKQINDSKGHAFGDALLVEVAKRLTEILPENSCLGRFSGDEFIIILQSKRSDFPKVRSLLTSLQEAFLQAYHLNGQAIFVTPSMGISLYPTDAQSFEQLIVNADTALYKAKEAGRNRILFFNSEMKEAFEKQHMMEQGLRDAIQKDQLTLVYQPQLNLKTERMESIEALLRWRHPEWGMVSPAEFIPVVEKSGYIQVIGDWVLETAIREIKEIHAQHKHVSLVAINISTLQLKEIHFMHKLKTLLKKYQVNPSFIELEITESIFIDGGEDVLETLKKIQQMGISIALDDFGTGYSSLNYLRILPINRVKIDKSFIQKMDNDLRVQAIIQSIIDLSHVLGFEIVAEGVETQKNLTLLRAMKTNTIQGFLYSKPLNRKQLQVFLDEEAL